MMRTKLFVVRKAVSIKVGIDGSHPVTFTGRDAIFKAAKDGAMMFV